MRSLLAVLVWALVTPARAAEVDQLAGCKPILLASFDQGVNSGEETHVWIHQKKVIRLTGGDALIDGGGESAIFAIREWHEDDCSRPG